MKRSDHVKGFPQTPTHIHVNITSIDGIFTEINHFKWYSMTEREEVWTLNFLLIHTRFLSMKENKAIIVT